MALLFRAYVQAKGPEQSPGQPSRIGTALHPHSLYGTGPWEPPRPRSDSHSENVESSGETSQSARSPSVRRTCSFRHNRRKQSWERHNERQQLSQPTADNLDMLTPRSPSPVESTTSFTSEKSIIPRRTKSLRMRKPVKRDPSVEKRASVLALGHPPGGLNPKFGSPKLQKKIEKEIEKENQKAMEEKQGFRPPLRYQKTCSDKGAEKLFGFCLGKLVEGKDDSNHAENEHHSSNRRDTVTSPRTGRRDTVASPRTGRRDTVASPRTDSPSQASTNHIRPPSSLMSADSFEADAAISRILIGIIHKPQTYTIGVLIEFVTGDFTDTADRISFHLEHTEANKKLFTSASKIYCIDHENGFTRVDKNFRMLVTPRHVKNRTVVTIQIFGHCGAHKTKIGVVKLGSEMSAVSTAQWNQMLLTPNYPALAWHLIAE